MDQVRPEKEEEARRSGRRRNGRKEDARQSGHICQQFVEFGCVSLNTDAVMGEASRDSCSSYCRLPKLGRRDRVEEVKNEVVDTTVRVRNETATILSIRLLH